MDIKNKIIIGCIAVFIIFFVLKYTYNAGVNDERAVWVEEQQKIKNDWQVKYNTQVLTNSILITNYEAQLAKLQEQKPKEIVKYVDKYIKSNNDCIIDGDIIELHNKFIIQ